MALVDPRLLDTLRSPPPPPATDTLGRKVQALDDEMKTILDRTDLDRCCSTACIVAAIFCVLLHVGVLLVIRQQSDSGVNVTAPVNTSVLLLF